MGREDDDAKNFSIGDALNVKRELAAISYRETGRHSYGGNKARAEQIAKALRNAATQEKEGAVVEVENTGSEAKPQWTVIVSKVDKRKK